MPMSDKEQMQLVKAWWKEYGYYILFSILFVMVANFGWRYWQRYQNESLEKASTLYMQMLTFIDQQKKEEVKLFGERLIKDYAKSPYASLAALVLAKNSLQDGKLQLAEEQLQLVIKKSPSKKLRQLARICAARILVTMKKPLDACKLLSIIDDHSYDAEINEALGDALFAAGKTDEAKKAYHKALDADAKRTPPSPLLKMKLQQF